MELMRRVYTYALTPDSQENSRVMHNDIEEEKVADNASRKRECNDIYYLSNMKKSVLLTTFGTDFYFF